MELAAIAVRWLHMAGAISLVGVFASLVLVTRPAARAAGDAGRERSGELDGRLLALGKLALIATLSAGVLDLWRQVGVATGTGLRESLEGDRVLSVLTATRYGTVWLARTWLLCLLGALLLLADVEDERDRLALRLQALGLSAASLVLGAMAGHSAAAEGGALATSLDGLHLLAAGVWGGGLVPLAVCLAWAGRLPSRAAAAKAAERL
jgi:putative copper resistance protein D